MSKKFEPRTSYLVNLYLVNLYLVQPYLVQPYLVQPYLVFRKFLYIWGVFFRLFFVHPDFFGTPRVSQIFLLHPDFFTTPSFFWYPHFWGDFFEFFLVPPDFFGTPDFPWYFYYPQFFFGTPRFFEKLLYIFLYSCGTIFGGWMYPRCITPDFFRSPSF